MAALKRWFKRKFSTTDDVVEPEWGCSACTFLNNPKHSKCAMCLTARATKANVDTKPMDVKAEEKVPVGHNESSKFSQHGRNLRLELIKLPIKSMPVELFDIIIDYCSGEYGFNVIVHKSPNCANTWKWSIGICPAAFSTVPGSQPGSLCIGGEKRGWGFVGALGALYHADKKRLKKGQFDATKIGPGSEYGEGDNIGVKMDFSAGTVTFSKNGKDWGPNATDCVSEVHAAVSTVAQGAAFELESPGCWWLVDDQARIHFDFPPEHNADVSRPTYAVRKSVTGVQTWVALKSVQSWSVDGFHRNGDIQDTQAVEAAILLQMT